MCALLASTEKIVRIVNRGQVYELLYTPESTPESTPDVALENLRSALLDLYRATLEMLANSSKLFSQNTALQTVNAILHPGETVGLFSQLADLETKLGYEVQACEAKRSAAVDRRLTDRLDAPLTRVDEGVQDLLEIVDDMERRRILQWISPIPFGKHHDEVKDSRMHGTCEWLIQHEKFHEWEYPHSSALLWLQGSREYCVGFPTVFRRLANPHQLAPGKPSSRPWSSTMSRAFWVPHLTMRALLTSTAIEMKKPDANRSPFSKAMSVNCRHLSASPSICKRGFGSSATSWRTRGPV